MTSALLSRVAPLALALTLGLSACGGDAPPASGSGANSGSANAPSTALGRMVANATDEARQELATKNLDLNATGQPKAEITPAGELLIGGKPVAVNDAQRKLLQEYRQGLIDVADAGMVIGTQSADLAGKAVSEAISGIFSGEPERIEQRIEVEAKKIEASALTLCERLPALKQAQDRLSASLPAFAPYAGLDMKEINDCRADIGGKVVDQQKLQQEIREDISGAVRSAVQDATSDLQNDAAAEAEAAGAAEQQR